LHDVLQFVQSESALASPHRPAALVPREISRRALQRHLIVPGARALRG
jgi:hypothetical protein